MNATTLHREWEVVRCSNVMCEHEHVREATGAEMLPCKDCHCEMIALPLRPDYAAAAERDGFSFGLDDMRQALGHAIRAASALARTADLRAQTQAAFLLRAEATGKAMAYQEALDMLDAATVTGEHESTAPAPAAGVVSVTRALIDAGNTVAAMAEIPPDDRRAVEAAVRGWRAWSAEAASVVSAVATSGANPEFAGAGA